MRSCCAAQGTLSNDRRRWEIIWEKECLRVYDWVTLLYSRDGQNTAHQLHFNKKIDMFLKKEFLSMFQLGLQLWSRQGATPLRGGYKQETSPRLWGSHLSSATCTLRDGLLNLSDPQFPICRSIWVPAHRVSWPLDGLEQHLWLPWGLTDAENCSVLPFVQVCSAQGRAW